jgi:hypothetical protein
MASISDASRRPRGQCAEFVEGIITSKATVSRDVRMLRREFATSVRDFDVLAEIGIRAEMLRIIASRAFRASSKTKDDSGQARLLKVAVLGSNSEIALLQSVGLLPHDLGTLRVQRTGEVAERVPSGTEMQERFANLTIEPDELVSEAERAWRYGDAGASEAAAADAADGKPKPH